MQFLQLVISGIAIGCIYGLIALGFVLIYKATETVSFAQGDLMMLGAFGGLAGMTMLGFPFWAAVIAATAILCAGLFAMFRYSKLGMAMQASSQNQLAAYYMGIPVKTLNGLVWGLAAAVAAIAGLLLAPITFVHANMGFIGLKAFPAAVVGGFTSLPGAIVGGLIIGIVESLSGFYLPAGFKDTAPYVVVLIMLMVKPNGLFGEKLRKKV